MKILHLMSCRGWSSDAYWAARISAELERAGHATTLVCKRGSEARVIDRARDAGATRIATLEFTSGVHGRSDARDVKALRAWWPDIDVVHVHRGKEHWLAALVNRVAPAPRPIVRTRHIVQAVRPHALNRWLYGRATRLVVTVTEAIRNQYVASGLVRPDRIVALPGGVDLQQFHPGIDGRPFRERLGIAPDVPLIGLVAGLRVMKGHDVAVEAARHLAARGVRFHLAFVGSGSREALVRRAVADAGLTDRISFTGFVRDMPEAMAAVDVALYAALESEGMSRVIFEYLAMGTPLVATRVGVIPEVLEHERTALLVPAGEPAALAAALEHVLADPALAARVGASGRELAATRLSGAEVARALAGHYARLAAA